LGKKNNPNRDNVSGKEQRLEENTQLTCSATSCSNDRYGYSKYCLQHKNHIAYTGSLEQEYIREFKSKLKPYVEVLEKQIEEKIQEKDSAILSSLEATESLLKYPSTINAISIDNALRQPLDTSMDSLPQHIINSFNNFAGDGKKLLAVVVSVYLFQKENPKTLLTGLPLFFHCGKLIYSYTKYERTLSATGRLYYKKRTLTKNQYINIGMKFYSKFHSVINSYIMQYESQSVNIQDNPLRVKKTPLECLIEEKQERIDFVIEQKKHNRLITDSMIQNEIKAIEVQFDKLIEEEKLKGYNGRV